MCGQKDNPPNTISPNPPVFAARYSSGAWGTTPERLPSKLAHTQPAPGRADPLKHPVFWADQWLARNSVLPEGLTSL